jgi:hypothetical protein
MRRVIPWTLLGLVGLAAGAAAALGAVGAPDVRGTPGVTPAQWVANVLATTAQAGTAHFDYTHVTTSPNPDLRGTANGRGVVDFSRGSVRVTEVDRQIEFEGGPAGPSHAILSVTSDEEIIVGTGLYQQLFPVVPGAHFPKSDFPFMKISVPRQPRAKLGLSFALGAASGLGDLDGTEPVVAVRDLGPAIVDGQASTRYLVQTAPVQACLSVHTNAPVSTESPSLIWVDGHGRLVRVRSTSRFSGRLTAGARTPPGFAQFPTGPIASTDTLTFSAFGAPVRISAPAPGVTAPEHGFSVGSAVSSRPACKSK